jgi:hypothetical protein
MAKDGDYPFIVIVWNRFTSSSDPTINVQFNHFPNGSPQRDIKKWLKKRTSPTTGATYSIKPGDMLGFPLYWGPELDDNFEEISSGETLAITYNPEEKTAPETPCYLYLGSKAKYEFVDDSGKQLTSGEIGTYIQGGIEGTNSGVWIIGNKGKKLIIKVKKLVVDPETTNVSIGPDIP